MDNTLSAMEHAKVPRSIYVSADTVAESRRELNFLRRYIIIPIVLDATAAHHDIDEAMVRQSRLDWIIVRPPILTNGPIPASIELVNI